MALLPPKCLYCLSDMDWSPKFQKWKCFHCIYVDLGQQIKYGPEIVIEQTDADCHCGHCHYDHVGFRAHLEGVACLRTSCRIAYCNCEAYHTTSYSCHTTHHPEAA